tara:strand:- start:44 stop:373 length:330 start_codon:yes stop_codon:yes gene_type:complete
MKLFTKQITTKLIKNFKDADEDHKPVVKLFGGGACTWLLSELDEASNMAFGLCDIGHGSAELGYVSVDELQDIRFPPFGGRVERDQYFVANKTLAEYAKDARNSGGIEA